MAVFKNDNITFFHRATYKQPHIMLQAHFHDNHELYYLEKGRTKYFIGDEIFILEAGDMVFVPKGVFHKTDGGGSEDTSRLLFSFEDGLVPEKYIEEIKENKLIRIPPQKQYKLKNIFAQIEEEEGKKESGYAEMQRLLFRQMIIIVSRYCTGKNEKNLNPSAQLVQKIAKYITENYGEDLSLDVLAKKFALSPSHLSRLFKNVTGVALSEYINISRITAAEKLLLSSGMTVTQVATACGFNDSNYFAAVFKKIKGITPKKYSMNKK